MDVFLYYDSISEASVIFPLSPAEGPLWFPLLVCKETHCPLPTEGPSNRGTRLDDLLVCWKGKT